MCLLYFLLSVLLFGLVYVIADKMSFFVNGSGSLEHLQTEIAHLRKNQDNTNKKLQSLNTRIKYGQIKSGNKSAIPVMPFSRAAMESTPFFSIIGADIFENISADGEISHHNNSPQRVVEIISDLDGKILVEDKTSNNIHNDDNETQNDSDLPDLEKAQHSLPSLTKLDLPTGAPLHNGVAISSSKKDEEEDLFLRFFR